MSKLKDKPSVLEDKCSNGNFKMVVVESSTVVFSVGLILVKFLFITLFQEERGGSILTPLALERSLSIARMPCNLLEKPGNLELERNLELKVRNHDGTNREECLPIVP